MESNFQLWEHQKRAYTLYRDKPAWLHLWEPRLGKTLESLLQAGHWIREHKIKRILVVASKTICGNVWFPEVSTRFPAEQAFTINLFNGTTAARKAACKKLPKFSAESNFPIFVIVNYEALRYFADELAAWRPEALILDEIHKHKTPSSERHRAVYKLRKTAKFVRGLSGTPTNRDYIDLYGIYKIMDDSIFGTRKEDFIARYCIMDAFIPGKVALYRDLDIMQQKMLSIADIVKKKDCFDMPKRFDVVRKIHLSPHLKKKYDEIAKTHILESHGEVFTLDHTLSRLSYLVQWAGGYQPKRGLIEPEWVHDEKLRACLSEIESITDAGKKVVVFYHYKAEGAKLFDALGPHNCAYIASETKGSERSRLIDLFNKSNDFNVMVIQDDIGSEGISLAAADYTIFYSIGTSWAVHEQARERTFKPGLDVSLTYIYLQCVGTMDSWAQGVIRRQQNLAQALLTVDFAAVALGHTNLDLHPESESDFQNAK